MRYEGLIYRPPSEAFSLILQVTIGCSHNKCTFCSMYKQKKYRVRELAEIEADIRMAKIAYGDVEKVFLADGDALAVETETLLRILVTLRQTFPSLRHIGIYASPGTILRKTPEELKSLYQTGLTMAYLGVETGDANLLQEIQKGVTPEEMIAAGQKLIRSGILLSCTVILGLAGPDWGKTERHARETALLINQISPHYLAALTLMLEPGTILYRKRQRGEFQLPEPYAIIAELQVLVKHLEVQRACIFRSNHASNYLPIKGTLPQDQKAILKALDQVLQKKEDKYLRPDYLRGL
ncbi:MAG: B12-binding domain-containing radical SAM protein [Syntrophomonadaceae bacterium]|nr:B12-binding domain-containing radical SAM protein [Syntrophomonadaceae bacterium]